ncbi:DUF3772 domain-containing protein [Shimia ponticola]|uniref:DUF3772 domain-containing protein n=1 Tax=Shimia ponticola TaxID=2582893 RepID=UPI002104F4B5|nr:DUF3772 domain-containing protein [Shimia ponticola]
MMRFIAVLILALIPTLALTQDVPDYAEWSETAARAEVAVENARASDAAFGDLRAEVARWRSEFQDAQGINEARLATLREQLTSLGPAPEEGATETAEIAARRAELQEQIQRAEAPQLTAGEAFRRANGIISEIDTILRERQQQQILNVDPSPFVIGNWPSAWRQLQASWAGLRDTVASLWSTETSREIARQNLPLILVLVSVALVLVLRVRQWSQRAAARIEERGSTSERQLGAFIVSLGQFLGPVLGVAALTRAIYLTELSGPRGALVLDALGIAAAAAFVAAWLAGRVFPSNDARGGIFQLDAHWRAIGRRMLTLLGVAYAGHLLITVFFDLDQYTGAARSVLSFPMLVVAGLSLFRLGQAMSQHSPELDEEGQPAPVFFDRLVALLAQVARLIGVAGIITAALGYTNLASYVVFSASASFALVVLLALLQDVIRDGYALLRGHADGRESLVPVLVGFAVILASLPVFALIWGTRPAELLEIWQTAQDGVAFGGVQISITSLLTLVLVFVAGFTLTRLVQSALRTTVLPKTQLDVGGRTALTSGIGYIGIFLAALAAISAAGLDLSSLAIVAGALSVGIGFGLQTVVSNFVSGIILLIERPISEGDWIEVGGNMGYVRKISVRSTRIETFDRTDVIVPNADLISGTVTNYTHGNSVGRVIVPVGVAYGTDTRKVEAILKEVAGNHPMVLLKPPPSVVFMGFGADSLDFEIRAILRDVNWVLSVKSDMNHAIAKRFTEEEIEIPFAQRDIWIRNPESMRKMDVHDMETDAGGDIGESDGGA